VATADGPCGNRRRIRRGQLEDRILDALGSGLMRPDLVADFTAEFSAEWNRLTSERADDLSGKRRELGVVERKLAGLSCRLNQVIQKQTVATMAMAERKFLARRS